jgi:hypothetical protein
VSRTAYAPSAIGWDIAEPEGHWHIGTTAVLLAVSSCYWLSTWLAAGLPPLTALACRRASRTTEPTEEASTHRV